jgi:hypothetical protein
LDRISIGHSRVPAVIFAAAWTSRECKEPARRLYPETAHAHANTKEEEKETRRRLRRVSGFQAAHRDTCQSVLVGFEHGILFRAVVDQPPILKLGVMTAGFPLQNLRPVLRLIASRTFTNYLEYLSFCHSGLKLRNLLSIWQPTHIKNMTITKSVRFTTLILRMAATYCNRTPILSEQPF